MNLNQVTIPSLNVALTTAFYQSLGLKLIVKAFPHYSRLESPEGPATFSIHLVEKLREGEGTYIYFECENLDEKVKELQAKGIEFIHPPKDQSWLWREARLKDPDGNLLILYYAGTNRKNPPWRIDESH